MTGWCVTAVTTAVVAAAVARLVIRPALNRRAAHRHQAAQHALARDTAVRDLQRQREQQLGMYVQRERTRAIDLTVNLLYLRNPDMWAEFAAAHTEPKAGT